MNSRYHKQGWKKFGRRKKIRSHFSGKKSAGLFSFSNKQALIKNGVLLLIALGIAGSLALLALFAFVSRDLPDPNTLTDRTISQTTKIFDRTGEHLLYEVYGDENRTLVKMQEGFCGDNEVLETDLRGIPLFAVQATIAAEDRGYCTHHGFDVKGLARSVFKNIFTGSRVGGSTLTQQLVKNAILSNEKTYIRKIKELILSLELERRYSKDELLQIYFNEIPYGSTYYGIQAASQNYFDKTVDEITLSEAAVLAALPQAPTRYLNNLEALTSRRDWILESMHELGYIDEYELEDAIAEEVAVEVNVTNIEAPHFVFYVIEQLEEEYGRQQAEEGGLKVITTLDYDQQIIAEEEVVKGVEENGEYYEFTNASLVAINPQNGQITAMVGSKDFFDEEIDGQVNIATRLRQPGSSFKPIVYALGFETGYTPNTVLWDVVTEFASSGKSYMPHNYDLDEHGPMRVREALQGSLNIPAVKMLYLVGVNNAIDFASRLGYTSLSKETDYGLSLVLGGGEVQLLEHVNAYATFANEGTLYEPVSILKVEDANGGTLFEWEEEKGEEVLDSNIARMITHVLKDNDARAYAFGTSSSLSLGERPVAAKTGTTNDYRDAWLVGYTPSLVAGVWAGNNDNTEMKRGSGGSTAAGPIWNSFMRRALEGAEIEYFTNPSIPQTGKSILDGTLESQTVTIDKASGLLATEYTPESQREEKTYMEYHSILHYVDISDPLGPAPENPENNYQYASWESAIETWILAEQEETGIEITQGEPPTEEDDVHVPENFPSVEITSPSNNKKLDDRNVTVEVEADSKRGVVRVEFYLDGYYLGTDTSSPFKKTLSIPNTIDRGYHTLKAIAYDDVDNSGSDTIGLQINSDPVATGFELIDPNNGQTIEKTSEEYTIVTSLTNPTAYSSVTVYAQQIGSGAFEAVDTSLNPSSPFITLTWTLPSPGSWVLYAKAVPEDGGDTLETAGIVVRITETDEGRGGGTATEEDSTAEGEETTPTDEDVFVSEEELNPFLNPPEQTSDGTDQEGEEMTVEAPTE